MFRIGRGQFRFLAHNDERRFREFVTYMIYGKQLEQRDRTSNILNKLCKWISEQVLVRKSKNKIAKSCKV